MRVLVNICFLVASTMAADWAVIVAGSNGFTNYRHQADACHAYQIVKKNGIPDNQIITMMYDDIANSKENPFKGKIFNKATKEGEPGQDVYEGCKIDYRGKNVNKENFIAVLTGNSSVVPEGLPVLQSTKEDRVFVNFVDHGAVGVIAFPNFVLLHADEIITAIKTAQSKQLYGKMLFYLEACESGSIFPDLDPSLNVYATTAAGPKESSWGTYCPPQNDVVNGKAMQTCLGDLYSVNWMEDADSADASQTLSEQFESVVKKTTQSQVMEFGDKSFKGEKIFDFEGDGTEKTENATGKTDSQTAAGATGQATGSVDSRDIPLHLAYYGYVRSEQYDVKARRAAGEALKAQIDKRLLADEVFGTLASSFAAPHLLAAEPALPVRCGSCCQEVNAAFHSACGGYDDYSMQYVRLVTNLCISGGNTPEHTLMVAAKLTAICQAAAGTNGVETH